MSDPSTTETSKPLPLPSRTASPATRERFLTSRASKRIVICCDGTWQDGIVKKKRWQYSNIIRLSRMVRPQDDREAPPKPQIVFYQAGVGSEHNIYAEYIEGATGASLAEKVQEAYAFIAHNFQPGDDIYLFGFSRGAYTARMVAAFIGEIGILDQKDMDHFADIFIAYQKLGSPVDQKEEDECKEFLSRFNNPDAKGKIRADIDGDTFTIKCLGVWDTVGSLGMPLELSFSPKLSRLFGFRDKYLGDHIQHAFHAMGLNETRCDFDVSKFEQTQSGREKGQILKQVWFPGSHSDVGGGWHNHDLADISLTWMAANVEDMLSLDIDYLRDIPRPQAPWGALLPHNPRTGIFGLTSSKERALLDKDTHEKVHLSVMFQEVPLSPKLQESINADPTLVERLLPLEEEIKDRWPYVPGKYVPSDAQAEMERQNQASEKSRLNEMAKKAMGLKSETMTDEGGRSRHEDTWLGSLIRGVYA